MSEDYIRDELQKATAEFIKAVRLAIARTKDAQRAAGVMAGPMHYNDMNRIQRFHEDRKISLSAFLHNLESLHSRGMMITIEGWLETTLYPRVGTPLEVLMGKEMGDDERERIRRELGVAEAGGAGGAGATVPARGPDGGGAAGGDGREADNSDS